MQQYSKKSSAMVKAVMSLYEGSKIKVKVGSELLKRFLCTGWCTSRMYFVTFVICDVVDVMVENAREGLMKEVLYTDDLVLMSEIIEGLKERFLKWRSGLESKGLKVILEKTKVDAVLVRGCSHMK